MSKFIHPVLRCVGSGTRLWPLSRKPDSNHRIHLLFDFMGQKSTMTIVQAVCQDVDRMNVA